MNNEQIKDTRNGRLDDMIFTKYWGNKLCLHAKFISIILSHKGSLKREILDKELFLVHKIVIYFPFFSKSDLVPNLYTVGQIHLQQIFPGPWELYQ